MLYSVRGALLHSEPGMAVVECGGVGFCCHISFFTFRTLPKRGEEVMLFTFMAVKEDAVTLYGFADPAELEGFKKLITVRGVGAKVALAILSELTPPQLALAVAAGDARAIARGVGVGPKLAQRILLELKDHFSPFSPDGLVPLPGAAENADSPRAEALSALVTLGYSQSEAAAAVAGCPDDLSAEAMIRRALRDLATRL